MFYKLGVLVKESWKSILFLPGTFLHELSHYLVAVLTGSTVVAFSLIPKVEFSQNGTYRVTYGSVQSVAKIKAAYILIGLSPLLLLIPIYYILDYLNFFIYHDGYYNINFNEALTLKNILWDILIIQLLSGCLPSSQDIKVVLSGIFSISGVVIITLIVLMTIYISEPNKFYYILNQISKNSY